MTQCHCHCMCRLLVVSSCRSRRHLVPRVTLSTHMSLLKCLVYLQTAQRNAQRPSTTLVGSSCADVLTLSFIGVGHSFNHYFILTFILTFNQPAFICTCWATLRCHCCLLNAAASASSWMSPSVLDSASPVHTFPT